MAWRRVRGEGATRGGRTAAFAQASVLERRAVLWRLQGSCVPCRCLLTPQRGG
ncbi:hypothetical protein [Dictyobacter vulcani]|uniref:hypothetical protein n=1 Tax=Dictyobacter vulcani TaxID=2607529 RepID=UPI001386AE4A|nr:hypothetical protein [Dictyobacter vulcani]